MDLEIYLNETINVTEILMTAQIGINCAIPERRALRISDFSRSEDECNSAEYLAVSS
jgi:hypothetical protein